MVLDETLSFSKVLNKVSDSGHIHLAKTDVDNRGCKSAVQGDCTACTSDGHSFAQL